MQWLNFFQQVDSNGETLKSLNRINIPLIVLNNIFSKLILNTKIADLYNILIEMLKKWVHNVFDKEKYVLHYENLSLVTILKLKKYIMC